MSEYEEVSGAVQFAEPPPKEERTALAIRHSISQVQSAMSEFDRISAGLADLAARYPVDLVYDVTTSKGMAEAIAHRAAWRDPRINVEKFRKAAKAPVLTLGRDIDARAAWLTEQLLVGEEPVHEQIKAEEQRKDNERQARINAEFGRVQAIQEMLHELHMEAATGNMSSAAIEGRIAELRERRLDPLVFQESLPQAEQARVAVLAKLEIALNAKRFSEAEAVKAAAERAELLELRRAQAEQKAKDAAAAEREAALQREKQAAELEAQRAEQRRLDAEAAAGRAEADRLAQTARDEADRLAKETRDAERHKLEQAYAAQKRLLDAAGPMLAALKALRGLVEGQALHIVNEAIALAE